MEDQTETNTSQRIALSFSERLAIFQVLQQHIVKTKKGAVYHDGWSDRAVAEAMEFNCGANHVATIRKEMFGDLARDVAPIPEEVYQRLRDIEDRTARLEAILNLEGAAAQQDEKINLMHNPGPTQINGPEGVYPPDLAAEGG